MRYVALLISCICYIHLYAQDHIFFSQINSNDGLSDNGVRGICQLHDGRMVIVTEGMVNIYNGSDFLYLHYSDREAYRLSKFYGWHITYIDLADNIWVKHQHKLLLFDVRKEKFVRDVKKIFDSYGINNPVADLFLDSEKNFWYITEKNELYLRQDGDARALLFIPDVSITENSDDQLIDIESIGNEAFFFYKSGLMICYDKSMAVEKYRENPFMDEENRYTLTSAAETYNGYLYHSRNGHEGGVSFRFNTKTRKWENIIQTDCWQNTMTLDTHGNCWISTFDGLWRIDRSLTDKQIYSPLQLVDGRQFETEITTQYNDKSGGLWVGSINRGMLYYHPDRFKFRNFGRTFFKIPEKEKLRVTSFTEIDSNILVGTHHGVFLYDRSTETLVPYDLIQKDTRCNMIFKDSDQRIWICTQEHGLYCIDNQKLRHFANPLSCQYFLEASDGRFYVCTDQGIGILDPATGNYADLESAREKGLGYTYYLSQTSENTLTGTSEAGIFTLDIANGSISFPDSENDIAFQHENEEYHCIYRDSRNLLWFGTQDGVFVYDPAGHSTRSFHQEDGLVNNAIRSIVEDNSGNIWISTSNGISCIGITGKSADYEYSFSNYNHYDGVIENEFLHRSVLKTSDNSLIWGGLDGFNTIDLNKIHTLTQRLSAPLITKFLLFGDEVKAEQKYDGDIILPQSISTTRHIDLKHNQNFIRFEFSALNYVNPSQTYYKYMLEGIDATWNEVSSLNGIGQATYTNLQPGTYQFKVYAANSSREWSNHYAEISFVVNPPFWKTPIAYLIYVVLTVVIISYVLYTYISWNKKRTEAKHKEELDQLKLSFFTNISHELRTPLTLILTPLDAIIKNQKSESLKKQLKSIYMNARELLNLVNQLLDFRKLEMKGEILQLSYCQVDEFMGNLVPSFKKLASEKHIQFSFSMVGENLHAHLDTDKFHKVINNLISNAIKFTPEGGKVELLVKKSSTVNMTIPGIIVQVTDTGCGIPENDLVNIFDRFFQSKHTGHFSGSGIGLHLVKEYVQMHKGTIDVKSRLGHGSVFTIEIPANLGSSSMEDPGIHIESKKSDFKILLVEDNTEFRTFLGNELSKDYKVLTAADGVEGLHLTRNEHPDLVISDIMMPEMSGTELCDHIKNDIHISHIPVILLTARASEAMQVVGFKVKADAYITKPFNMEILQLRIRNLIDQQQERKQMFKNAIVLHPKSITASDLDRNLIANALRHIENNIDNPSYSVQELSNDLFMDRTGFYRKIVALADQTPSEFIRSVRLKKAALLLERGYLVYEVTEKVGFGSSSYFIKCFQKEFGVKPSDYKNKQVTHLKESYNHRL